MSDDEILNDENPNNELVDALTTLQNEVNNKMGFLHGMGIVPLDPMSIGNLKLEFFVSSICGYLDDHFGTENTATEFEIEWYKLIKDILDEAIKQQPADKRQEGLVLL